MKPKQVIEAMENNGWVEDRQKGSHRVFEKPNKRPVIVPDHGNKDLKPGTLHNILKSADLEIDRRSGQIIPRAIEK